MTYAAINNNDLVNEEHTHYMAISLKETVLIAAQSELLSLESIHDLDRNEPSEHSVGWVYCDNTKIPVFGLTDDLDLGTEISDTKSICIVLSEGKSFISLLCKETNSVSDSEFKSFPLPECMQAANTPIHSLCLYKNKAGERSTGFVLSVESLLKYINSK